MLIKKYKNAEKVNIYCYACSEGAEPFSLAMLLLKTLKDQGIKDIQKEFKKFFPIIASDIDEEILKNPKQGIIKLSRSDIKRIETILGKDYSDFIEFDNNFQYSDFHKEWVCNGKIKPILKDKVIFKTADIRSDILNIKGNNNVILCRNFWTHLLKTDQQELAKNLFKNIGENSMCIIGEHDCDYSRDNYADGLLLLQKFTLCHEISTYNSHYYIK